jgi:hypothetical protein
LNYNSRIHGFKIAEIPPINNPSNKAYPELKGEYCGLKAAC